MDKGVPLWALKLALIRQPPKMPFKTPLLLIQAERKVISAGDIEHVGNIVNGDGTIRVSVVYILITAAVWPTNWVAPNTSTYKARTRKMNRIESHGCQLGRGGIIDFLGPGVGEQEIEAVGISLLQPDVHTMVNRGSIHDR